MIKYIEVTAERPRPVQASTLCNWASQTRLVQVHNRITALQRARCRSWRSGALVCPLQSCQRLVDWSAHLRVERILLAVLCRHILGFGRSRVLALLHLVFFSECHTEWHLRVQAVVGLASRDAF